MKSIIFAMFMFLAQTAWADFAHTTEHVCEPGTYGKWTKWQKIDHLVSGWDCDLQADDMGGFTIGVGKIYQAMVGDVEFSCKAYAVDGTVLGCYREGAVMAGIGAGGGIALRLVKGLHAKSYGLRLVDLEPENFVGFFNAGLNAETGFTIGDLSRHGLAQLDFSAANGWSDFSIQFSDYDDIGFYLGATINGIILAQKDYDGIVTDTAQAVVDFFTSVLKPLKDDGTFSSAFTLEPENIVDTKNLAREMAKNHPQRVRDYGINLYEQNMENLSQADFIDVGLRRAKNTCDGGYEFVTAYAYFECENTERCSYAYFRSVCK